MQDGAGNCVTPDKAAAAAGEVEKAATVEFPGKQEQRDYKPGSGAATQSVASHSWHPLQTAITDHSTSLYPRRNSEILLGTDGSRNKSQK